jgi:hypothetical protein
MINKERLDERVQIETAWARENMTFEQATYCFARFKVVLDEYQALYAHLNEAHQHALTMLIESGLSSRKQAAKLRGLALDLHAAMLDSVRQATATAGAVYKGLASKRAKDAADHRHSSPGGAREKAEAMQRAWASGKYSSRDRCAEEECAALGMSFSTARKALRNIPKPS